MKDILFACNDLLNIPFTFLGFKVSLMAFLLFDMVSFLLIWVVFRIFNSQKFLLLLSDCGYYPGYLFYIRFPVLTYL